MFEFLGSFRDAHLKLVFGLFKLGQGSAVRGHFNRQPSFTAVSWRGLGMAKALGMSGKIMNAVATETIAVAALI